MELGEFDVIMIDGRSGSGKTSMTERLAKLQLLVGGDSQVLHVEDLYPGWDGLDAGSRAVAVALAEGGYRRYDWNAGEFGEWVSLTSCRPLIIEGCGSITSANVSAARSWAASTRETNPAGSGTSASPIHVHTVWLDGSAEVRRERAFARDGDTFRPHWDRWAAQEERHFALTRPESIADEIIRIE